VGVIRLFLAASVLQSHVFAHILAPNGLIIDNTITLGMAGGYAVMFFFVISGFLISFVLEEKYDRPGGVADFYQARAIRIYPLWWSVWIVAALLFGFARRQHILDFLTSFFLIGSDSRASFWSYPLPHFELFPIGTALGWSLATELLFYIVAPFLLRSNRACIVVFVASALFREIINRIFPLPGTDLYVWNAWAYCFFPSTVLFFLLGHLSRELFKKFPMPNWMAFSGLAVVAASCLLQDGAYAFENIGFYFAILVFAAALPAIFEATKDNAVSNFLGDLSYPLYLTHGLLLVALVDRPTPLNHVMHLIMKKSEAWAPAVWPRAILISFCVFALAMLVSVITRFAVEIPMSQAFRAVLTRLRSVRPVVRRAIRYPTN